MRTLRSEVIQIILRVVRWMVRWIFSAAERGRLSKLCLPLWETSWRRCFSVKMMQLLFLEILAGTFHCVLQGIQLPLQSWRRSRRWNFAWNCFVQSFSFERSIDWLIDWLTDCSIDWSIDCLIDWLCLLWMPCISVWVIFYFILQQGISRFRNEPFKDHSVVSTHFGGAVCMSDLHTAEVVKVFHEHLTDCTDIVFSPTNATLAISVGLDNRIVFYDMREKKWGRKNGRIYHDHSLIFILCDVRQCMRKNFLPFPFLFSFLQRKYQSLLLCYPVLLSHFSPAPVKTDRAGRIQ